MSLFVTAAAIVMVSFLPGNEAGSTNAKTISDVEKLQTVEEAMRSFMAFNGRRPCPADGQYPELGAGSQYFGKEAGTPGTCQGNTAPTPNAPLGPDASGNIVTGVIPTRSIGLDTSYAFDSYGRRFTYVVDTRATKHSSCQVLEGLTPTSTAATGKGGLYIDDIAGTQIDQVMYAYIQHGPSGYGAWPGDGSATTLTTAQSAARRVNSGSTNKWMQINAGVTPTTTNPGAATFSSPLQSNTLYKNSMILPSTTGGLDTGFNDIIWYRDDLKNTCCLGINCIPVGFRIDGIHAGDYTGWSLATGDINGDGIPDLVIGAVNASVGGHAGAVYVVFGTKAGFPDPLPLSTLNGSNGFELDGSISWSSTGNSVAVADVNHDGTPDIIIGTAHAGADSAYVVFGGKTGANNGTGTAWTSCPCTLNGSYLNGTNGLTLTGLANSEFGNAVAAGDVNGDGIPDIIVGAPWTTVQGNANAGSAYVLYGHGGAWSSSIAIAGQMDGVHGVEFDAPAASEDLGGYISTASGNQTLAAADVNGDGVADLVMGAPYATVNAVSHSGAIYTVFGKSGLLQPSPQPTITVANGSTTNATVSATTGLATCQTLSASGTLTAGTTISTCGGAATCGIACTSTSVVLSGNSITGTGSPVTVYVAATPLNATYLNGTNGVEYDGSSDFGIIGGDVAIGKVNGGTYNGIITAANLGEQVVVIFGRAPGSWPASATTVDYPTINGTDMVALGRTTAGGSVLYFGSSVAVGDVNGDGIGDLLAGSYIANGNAGIGYVVFGKNPLLPQTTVSTTSGSNVVTVASASGLMVGQYVSSANIPAGSYIMSISGNTVTLNWGDNATATASGTPFYVSIQPINSSYINGTNGVELDGPTANAYVGTSAASCDINGDGVSDVIFGAYNNTVSGANVGSVYVYYGKKKKWPYSAYSLGGL